MTKGGGSPRFHIQGKEVILPFATTDDTLEIITNKEGIP
jgi:hypothetical protein